MSPPRTLVVWCPDWPIIVLGLSDRLPAAIAESERIVALSPTAKQSGITVGQHRREAQSRCLDLLVFPRDRDGERRAFEPIVRTLEQFGSTVALGRSGWAAFETRGPARYFGGEEALARAVVCAVDKAILANLPGNPSMTCAAPDAGENPGGVAGTFCRIGISEGPFAATMAARLGIIVRKHSARAFLSDVPIEVLGQSELVTTLQRLGITTLGAFGSLEEGDVIARFGSEGAHAYRLARGEEGGSFTVRHRREFFVEQEIDPPAQQIETALFVARSLADKLFSTLGREGLASSHLEVVVESSENERLCRRWSRDGPWNVSLVVEQLRWQLEAWFAQGDSNGNEAEYDPERGVRQIVLRAVEVTPDIGRQYGLFGQHRVSDERVARVLVRVQGMLGREGLLQAKLVGGRGPAERIRFVPFGDLLESGAAELPWPGRLPAPNPAVVFFEPLPLAVLDDRGITLAVDARGTLSAAPAAVVFGSGVREPVVSFVGPWPVEERWWDGPSSRRRARLQIVIASGDAYLIGLERGCWFAEGHYD